MFVFGVVVPPPPGFTPPELDVAGFVVPVFPDDPPEEGGVTDAAGVVLVAVVLVVEECEVGGGRLAAAAVGTVSGETPLVFANVEVPPPLPPQAAIASAASTPIKPAATGREKPEDTVLMTRAAPSAVRSAGSRSDPSA